MRGVCPGARNVVRGLTQWCCLELDMCSVTELLVKLCVGQVKTGYVVLTHRLRC